MTIESAPRLTPKLTSTGMPRRARSMCRASAWERQCFPPGTTLPTCEIAQAMLSVFADVLNSLGERTQPRSSKGRTEGYGNTQRAIRIAESNRAALTTSHSSENGRQKNLLIFLIVHFYQAPRQELICKT